MKFKVFCYKHSFVLGRFKSIHTYPALKGKQATVQKKKKTIEGVDISHL